MIADLQEPEAEITYVISESIAQSDRAVIHDPMMDDDELAAALAAILALNCSAVRCPRWRPRSSGLCLCCEGFGLLTSFHVRGFRADHAV